MEYNKVYMDLRCSKVELARAEGEDGTENVTLSEFRFPWNGYPHNTKRFFIVTYNMMDWDSYCWDRMFNDLRSAMACFGKEANRKYRCGGEEFRRYGRVEYNDEWYIWRDELRPVHDEPRSRSACGGDYGPSNPWDAPGMKISDFI